MCCVTYIGGHFVLCYIHWGTFYGVLHTLGDILCCVTYIGGHFMLCYIRGHLVLYYGSGHVCCVTLEERVRGFDKVCPLS